MTAKRDYTTTPEYWSISPATFDAWVDLLGYAAAGKLMAACCEYFLHGTEPEQAAAPDNTDSDADAGLSLAPDSTTIVGIQPQLLGRKQH